MVRYRILTEPDKEDLMADINSLETRASSMENWASIQESMNISDTNARVTLLESSELILANRIKSSETAATALALRVSSVETSSASLALRVAAVENDVSSIKTWRANKANKINNPATAITTGTGLNLSALGLGVALSLSAGNSMKAAIEELQTWAAFVSSNIFVNRELMKAS